MKTPMVIIIGPSGVGKSSFLERALKDFKNLRDAITFTTRPMRNGESEGNPYFFVTPERFEDLIQKNFFIEYARVHGNLYGTPYSQLEAVWREGACVVVDLDVQGAKTFKAKYPDSLTVFILPPSVDMLRQRVVRREGTTPPDLELRMKNAEIEMNQASQFDHQITNDNFDVAYGQFKKLVEDYLKTR